MLSHIQLITLPVSSPAIAASRHPSLQACREGQGWVKLIRVLEEILKLKGSLMSKFVIISAIISCAITQLCAQNDSLTQILDDIQDDGIGLNNWLEIIADQIIEKDKSSVKKFPEISLTHRFQYTLEKNEAIAHQIFLGSPYESYTRIRMRLYTNLSAGVLVQKDVGELSFTDHYSGYISWNHPTHDFKMIFGNFFIRSAEGLLLSSPFSLPKLALIKKPSSGRYLQTRPFLTSNEYDGLWGGAVEIGLPGSVKLVAFYSHILRDGIHSGKNMIITGFERSGYHRTFTERSRANRIGEKSYGGAFTFPLFFINQIGFNYVKTQYSPEIVSFLSSEERRRDYFKFHGSNIENFSLFYAQNLRIFYLSGEIIPQKSKKIAHIATLNFSSSNWYFVLKSWYIPSQLQSPYGRIPSDSNPFPQSVKGFMFGLIGNPLTDLKITAFWFLKKDLWRSYFQPLPIRRKEFYFQSEYRLGQKKYIYLRYHVTSNNFYSSNSIGKSEKLKHGFRIQLKQSFSTKVRIQTRLEKILLNYPLSYLSKSGLNFYQDLHWQLFKQIAFRIRFSSFYTDDYDSRLYEYENDLPHVFSNFALYGRGRKWYVMITAQPTSKVRLWLKYRRITYDGVNSIGSGKMTIGGDMRQDVHLQVEFRY
jgi:hypothetical protein